MAEVTVYDAERMKAIEDASVVNGEIDVNGHLVLTRFDESEIDAGLVASSPRIVTSATRPTAPDLYHGMQIYETDTNKLLVWNNVAWIDLGFGTILCTAATRPATPYNGMRIYETDTKRTYVHDGTNWLLISPMPHSEGVQVTGTAQTTTSATFVNANPAVQVANFVKYRADTKLLVAYDGAVYNDNNLGQYEVAVRINGTDYPINNAFGNQGGSGSRMVTGIPAGTYNVDLRVRRVNAVGTVGHGGTGNFNQITVTETL